MRCVFFARCNPLRVTKESFGALREKQTSRRWEVWPYYYYYYWIRAGSVLAMFGFGNQKDKLREKYSKLMQESFDLSTVNREKSDQKRAEAEEVGKQLDALEKRA